MWFLSGEKGDRRLNIRWLTTRNVSKSGTNKTAKPSAGADCKGNVEPGFDATLMNLITSIELTRPINNEPVSPINILAGLKLYIKKATRLPVSDSAITEYITSPD